MLLMSHVEMQKQHATLLDSTSKVIANRDRMKQRITQLQRRGGVEIAGFNEWGGKNPDGTEGFKQHRPGWEMPVQYTSLLEEHHTVRTAAGIFDVSHMGELVVRGPQARQLVDYISTNAADRLQNGQAHYSGLLYPQGGFVDDILVHKVSDTEFFICVNAANQDKDFAHIQAYNHFQAEVENAGPRYAQIALQGPLAAQILTDFASLKYYWFSDGQVFGVPVRVARTAGDGSTGAAAGRRLARPRTKPRC